MLFRSDFSNLILCIEKFGLVFGKYWITFLSIVNPQKCNSLNDSASELLHEFDNQIHESIVQIVGKPIPNATLKMVHRDAYNALIGKMSFDQYFLRTSQTKRKATK